MPETISIPDLIRREAVAAKIPPELALAVAEQESGFDPTQRNPTAVNGEHAVGVFQFLPSTARSRGVDPEDPLQNIRGGVAYLRDLLDQHQDVEKALAAYGGVRTNTTYVPGVLARVKKYQAQAQGTTAQAVASPPPQPGTTMTTNAVGAPPPTAKGWISPTQGITESIGRVVIDTYNPFTPSGRRNIGGTVGGLAAGLLAAPSGPGAVVAATAGAAVGGGFAGAVNNLIEGTQDSTFAAAGEQAGSELLGHATFGVPALVARRLLALPVAKNAAKALTAKADAVLATYRTAVDQIRSTRRVAKLGEEQAARELKRQGTAAVARAETRAAGLVDAVATEARNLLGTAPPRTATGRQAAAVAQGPAKSTLDRLGQQISDAAASGPDLPLTSAREKAQQIFDTEIKDLETYFSGTTQKAMDPNLAGYLKNAMSKGVAEADRARFVQALTHAGIEPTAAEDLFEKAKHPAMGVLRRIINAPETVPFAAAHQFKRQLDESVNYASPASTLLKQATKGIRGALRQDLASHEPYNAATAAYERTLPLFRSGYGETLRRTAQTEPWAFIKQISPDDPHQVQMLRELLVDLPTASGARAEGEAAWESVRAVWTAEKLLSGDVATLGERLDKLPGDFVDTFYGDTAGRQQLQNLRQVAGAYQSAVEQGRLLVEDAKGQAAAAFEAIKRAQGTSRVRAADDLQALRTERWQQQRALKAERTVFEESSVAPDKKITAVDTHIADITRAFALGPHTYLGAYSLGRLLHGPRGQDLLRWAQYSPEGTQALVQVFTSRAPAPAMAQLWRIYRRDVGLPESGGDAIGTPPPTPPR